MDKRAGSGKVMEGKGAEEFKRNRDKRIRQMKGSKQGGVKKLV